jgi:DNA-binding SARP family transcriptional activator/Tfp pilus assembly protein PilF
MGVRNDEGFSRTRLASARFAAGQPHGELTVRLLGPLAVSIGGRPVELTAGRLRSLLAVLAVSAGQTVAVDRLAAALWHEELPGNSRRSVQTYMARMRSTLGAARIVTRADGYALRADPEDVDVVQFPRLLDAALDEADATVQRERLAGALALWRGRPFEDVPSAWLQESVSPRLLEQYYTALERRIDLDIAQGRYEDLAAELGEHTAQHPLREPLWARRLIVLDRCGRQAEALSCYEAVRVRIAGELGADPGPELRRIHADLLAGRAPAPVLGARRRPVPQQLPADLDGFAGRIAALKELDARLPGERESRKSGTAVVVVHGAAGVGKTSLVVHWANQVRDRFSDGHLYVSLRGYGAGSPMEPAEAIRGFLDALGVPPQQIPTEDLAQAALYRSLLAGKRMLVVLDNARDAGQARPLLPASPGCLVVVTSRHQLPGLVAAEGAHPVTLDVPSAADAYQLLAQRLGEDRLAAEPGAAHEIIERCGRLPLALAVVAARAAAKPDFPLEALATQLTDSRGNLDAFATGDADSDIRTLFSWSYDALSSAAARLFRLLALHPGPDVTAAAAASLAGIPARQARTLLAELGRAHLVDEITPGRYTLHDLLFAYAAELAHTHDSDLEQRATLRRVLDHYLHTAHTASQLISTPGDPVAPAPAQYGVTPESPADLEHAMAWFTAERPVLLATVRRAAATGFHTHAWQLAWCTNAYLNRQGHWPDLIAVQRTALDAAREQADLGGQARAQAILGFAYGKMNRLDDAYDHLWPALDLSAELGQRTMQAHVHSIIADLLGQQARPADALRHGQRALDMYREAGHRRGEAGQRANVGWYHCLLGDYQQALAYCEEALVELHELGNHYIQAAVWDTVGYSHQQLGDHQQASDCYRSALNLIRKTGGRLIEAQILAHIGDNHQTTGDAAAARTAWRDALIILDDLSHPNAGLLRAKLDGLPVATTALRPATIGECSAEPRLSISGRGLSRMPAAWWRASLPTCRQRSHLLG